MKKNTGMTLVKVAEPNVWKWKHRVIWEAAYGPIPQGYCIIFKDGDKGNFSLENLVLDWNISKSRKPVGSERMKKDTGMTLVKVTESNVWKLKHHVIWEAVYGPIPQGYCITFKDGDKGNFSLENLVLEAGIPKFCKPVGSERMNDRGKTLVKVAEPNVWEWKHHVIWEAVYGPIPQGYCITFKDGDEGNFSLENLAMIDIDEVFFLNKKKLSSKALKNKELYQSALQVAKVNTAIKGRRQTLSDIAAGEK